MSAVALGGPAMLLGPLQPAPTPSRPAAAKAARFRSSDEARPRLSMGRKVFMAYLLDVRPRFESERALSMEVHAASTRREPIGIRERELDRVPGDVSRHGAASGVIDSR